MEGQGKDGAFSAQHKMISYVYDKADNKIVSLALIPVHSSFSVVSWLLCENNWNAKDIC